ncbi:MAG: DUF2635 domain-containing protein [Myxococcota bacterium]
MTRVRPAKPGIVIPIPGKKNPDGSQMLLPDDGMDVDVNARFWLRRIREGSVVRVAPVKPEKKPKKPQDKPAKELD